jgi:hypothetical protein
LRILGSRRLWRDVIAPAALAQPLPYWRQMVEECLAAQTTLNYKERAFLYTLSWRGTPSDKQLAWLQRIYQSIRPPRPGPVRSAPLVGDRCVDGQTADHPKNE